MTQPPAMSRDLAADDLMAPRIVAFWETMLFGAGTYSGNAFQPRRG